MTKVATITHTPLDNIDDAALGAAFKLVLLAAGSVLAGVSAAAPVTAPVTKAPAKAKEADASPQSDGAAASTPAAPKDEPAAEPTGPTVEEATKVVLDFAAKAKDKGAAAKAIISKFGGERLTTVDPKHYAAIVAEIEAASAALDLA